MEKEDGSFIMYGVRENDPECIHTVDEAIDYINRAGFLPLFKNEIPGFSLEERTVPDYWWSDDEKKDPWIWRMTIAGRRDILYGKFFNKKAGFISKKWVPVFANYRRDGYDFDARYEDGKASAKEKKLMDFFQGENMENEILSNELKKLSGFGNGGEKGYDGAVTSLMMQMYITNCDFKKRRNKRGEEYGWNVAAYSSTEHISGFDHVRSLYNEDPETSRQRIFTYMHEFYPIASDKLIERVVAGKMTT